MMKLINKVSPVLIVTPTMWKEGIEKTGLDGLYQFYMENREGKKPGKLQKSEEEALRSISEENLWDLGRWGLEKAIKVLSLKYYLGETKPGSDKVLAYYRLYTYQKLLQQIKAKHLHLVARYFYLVKEQPSCTKEFSTNLHLLNTCLKLTKDGNDIEADRYASMAKTAIKKLGGTYQSFQLSLSDELEELAKMCEDEHNRVKLIYAIEEKNLHLFAEVYNGNPVKKALLESLSSRYQMTYTELSNTITVGLDCTITDGEVTLPADLENLSQALEPVLEKRERLIMAVKENFIDQLFRSVTDNRSDITSSKSSKIYVDADFKKALNSFGGEQYNIANYISEEGPPIENRPAETWDVLPVSSIECILKELGCQFQGDNLELSQELKTLIKRVYGSRVFLD